MIFLSNQSVSAFLTGLRKTLGPIIRAMLLISLEQALKFIEEEDNIIYSQKFHQFDFNSQP